MNKLFCLSIVAISLTACNSNSAGYKATPANQTAAPVINTPAPVTSSADSNNNVPVTTTLQVPPVTQAKTITKTSGALNPAHGQPGHRCDIAEGAPLNSTPVAPVTNTPVTNTPVINQTMPVIQPQVPVKSNVRLNPEHGQPGHDCAIAVGQPLKS